MKKYSILLIALGFIMGIIITITLAGWLGGNSYFVFYHLLYGIIISTVIPILYVKKVERGSKETLGIKPIRLKQVIVLILFVGFSVGGQMRHLAEQPIQLELFLICIMPLIMTTFFEEFLFRGFLQTRFEKACGPIAAVILSGLFFAVYHLGYPGFRSFKDIAVLFLVGIMFALAFKLSDNNMIVSYLVNLPNAFLTYMFKSKQFPHFDLKVTIVSSVAAAVIIAVCIISFRTSSSKKSFMINP